MYRLLVILILLTIGSGLAYSLHLHQQRRSRCYDERAFQHAFVIAQAQTMLGFNLVDPEQAPPSIRESVIRGYHTIINTPFYAPDYAHGELSCTNCHFLGGDTLGGKNGGISLVGVTTEYPQYSKRSGKVISLAERINNCFQRSMDGNPLPLDSQTMKDILNYLHWISQEVEHFKDIPWLGLPKLKSTHHPDPKNGKKVYEANCQACHREDGQGGGILDEVTGKTIPPLWGPDSFNDGAGMSTMPMIAPFVYLNMPYQQAGLTEEEALDVAAFVLQQPRPHFNPPK